MAAQARKAAVSTSGVSRVLTAAGFQRSKTTPTRIHGWREYGPGFMTESRGDGAVLVEWTFGSYRRVELEERRPHLERMAEVLRGKGYCVEVLDSASWLRLSVTRPSVEG